VNVTDIKSRTVKTYTLTIEGGEVRDVRYSNGRRYRITRVEVIKADGNISGITLSGPVVKKDGTDSLNGHTERLYRNDERPDWLLAAIKGLA
jgi:hypothetical protein